MKAKHTEEKEYDDIPGTFVFDAERSRRGYHVNMFCMSLLKEENRKAFKANEVEYLKKYPMTDEQRDAILKRQWNRILELGGNIYFTAKLGATDGMELDGGGSSTFVLADPAPTVLNVAMSAPVPAGVSIPPPGLLRANGNSLAVFAAK